MGSRDANIREIEEHFDVRVAPSDEAILVYGAPDNADRAVEALEALQRLVTEGRQATTRDANMVLQSVEEGNDTTVTDAVTDSIVITHRGKPVRPQTVGQARYVQTVRENDLAFCIGPAGTGKTFLAMALAVAALRNGDVSRIVLTRPIVEAGEQLGFLPGDVVDKVQPYLRPLHDSLNDIIGFNRFQRLMAKGVIEVMPLAYMRGRTINDAVMVLDEAQNSTPSQMKMFLTRMGFGSKMVVTGDTTQTDLPDNVESGLNHSLQVLKNVKGIGICELRKSDIVRHALVQRIVEAYEESDKEARSSHSTPQYRHQARDISSGTEA